jgi:hypothetical protein
VANHGTDPFCLYLWRSVEAPGILYLATGVDSARAVYAELVEVGYIVRAIHMNTDTEYEMREGMLMPVPPTTRTAVMDRQPTR